MSRNEVVHYDSPPFLIGTAAPTTSGCVNVRHHEVQALRAVEVHASSPPDLRFEATCSVPPSTAGWPDIQQEPSRVDSDDATLPHEMLPWGCHYCNHLVSQAGHAWVAADLSADPQVARAMRTTTELSAAEDGSQPIPTLLTYSYGSVTANGALDSAAAMLHIGSDDVFVIVRLTSADTALSGRSEWTGLLLVLYIAKHVRGNIVVRLGNLRVAIAFTDAPWRFRRNWLRRNDRDLASFAWRLANDWQMAWGARLSCTNLGIPRSGNERHSSTRTRCTTPRSTRSPTKSTTRCPSTSPFDARSAATPRSGTSRSRRRPSGTGAATR